jgi:hypothetical protein
MEYPILDWWHCPSVDLFDHLVQFARVLIPIRKIKALTALDNIGSDEPGCGSNIAIPRPLRFIAVTLETMLLHIRTRCGTNPSRFRNRWWVAVILSNRKQLNEPEEDNSDQQNVNKRFFHFRSLSFLESTSHYVLYINTQIIQHLIPL